MCACVQEEMLRAQQQKEQEEAARRLEEEQRKQKLEIEMRRRAEEETFRLAAEKAASSGKQQADEEAKRRAEREAEARRNEQLMEQEKRDHDLAMRLAADMANSEIEPIKFTTPSAKSPTTAKMSPTHRSNGGATASSSSTSSSKYDLSKWKYAELRDAINTSCDLELLDACREEFHRRLKCVSCFFFVRKIRPSQPELCSFSFFHFHFDNKLINT